ncbi:hypothetical protein F5Y07DRAFT_381501, partial [Xylaria sp. FL0933]
MGWPETQSIFLLLCFPSLCKSVGVGVGKRNEGGKKEWNHEFGWPTRASRANSLIGCLIDGRMDIGRNFPDAPAAAT